MLTNILLLLNSILYLGPTLLDGQLDGGGPMHRNIINWGADRASALANGEYYRLLTSTFLHANLSHFVLNMYSLYNLGPGLEKLLGSDRLGIIYILSGLAGSIGTYIIGPLLGQNTNISSVGASGAIFGLLGTWIVYIALNPDYFQSGALTQILFITVLNIGFGFYANSLGNSGSMIGNAAHIGGLVAGMIMGYIFTAVI
ncbi:MAG: hypothetical protein OHK0017_00490 [Patescibacteria group bacterium]